MLSEAFSVHRVLTSHGEWQYKGNGSSSRYSTALAFFQGSSITDVQQKKKRKTTISQVLETIIYRAQESPGLNETPRKHCMEPQSSVLSSWNTTPFLRPLLEPQNQEVKGGTPGGSPVRVHL